MGGRFCLNITLKCHPDTAFFLPIEDSAPVGKDLNPSTLMNVRDESGGTKVITGDENTAFPRLSSPHSML